MCSAPTSSRWFEATRTTHTVGGSDGVADLGLPRHRLRDEMRGAPGGERVEGVVRGIEELAVPGIPAADEVGPPLRQPHQRDQRQRQEHDGGGDEDERGVEAVVALGRDDQDRPEGRPEAQQREDQQLARLDLHLRQHRQRDSDRRRRDQATYALAHPATTRPGASRVPCPGCS